MKVRAAASAFAGAVSFGPLCAASEASSPCDILQCFPGGKLMIEISRKECAGREDTGGKADQQRKFFHPLTLARIADTIS